MGNPTLTYQWQRYTGGAWVDIGGATTANRAPVDADFGLALRLAETPNGITALTVYSNSTGLTAEAPAQSLGNELLQNNALSTWSGDNPSSWSVGGESGSDPQLTERDPNQGHADTKTVGGAANYYSSAVTNQPSMFQTILSIGSYYESLIEVSNFVGGSIRLEMGDIFPTLTAIGTYRILGRATWAVWNLRAIGAPDVTVNSTSSKLLTINTQLIAPGANMRLDQFYSLPATPADGSQTWLYARISDFATGNFWKVELVYNGSQWNINLYSVATFTKTSRIAATNIGATNGVRVNMNGDQLSLWTTADGGANWTQRGTTITNSTYQTATGVNAIWTSDVTPGNLVYAPAA
jgi:hypothetical protein